MDRGGALSVLQGYSGAPVWSADVSAFVGIVVTESANEGVSWCIPSRILCQFHGDLPVRFRIPPADRPLIHDYDTDDPNIALFGTVASFGTRRLTATVWNRSGGFRVELKYECVGRAPRGRFVTIITYPDFAQDDEDAYELFAELRKSRTGESWSATQEIYPDELFTVAAVGDGGDTALTVNLDDQYRSQKAKVKSTKSARP